MAANMVALFRAQNEGHCVYRFAEGAPADIVAEVRVDGCAHPLLLPVMPVSDDAAGEGLCFTPVPLALVDASYEVELREGCSNTRRSIAAFSFDALELKWRSRLSYRMQGGIARRVRRAYAAHQGLAPSIEVIGVYPMTEKMAVVRFKVHVPGACRGASWRPEAFAIGDGPCEVIEFSTTCGFRNGREDEAVLCSAVVSRGAVGIVLAVQDVEGGRPGAIFSLSCAQIEAHMQAFFDMTTDAKADGRYDEWFLRHAATKADLAVQRATRFTVQPRFSIVIPVFEPQMDYLIQAVESVAAQSYANWELVLVNASPERVDVVRFISGLAADDSRFVNVQLEGNLGIAGNSEKGIRQASGDYIAFLDQDDTLEPDCLYEYAKAIEENPGAGLLYCDEDSFADDRLGFFAPLLKPDFNLDLLYSHNYIVHMLAVSHAVVDAVELPDGEVDGAQDYDLCLKAWETELPIVHVPKVLYHWRQHAGSTNAGNSAAKPYAIAAGQRALQGHFARRGIDAQVEPTDVPYVYKSIFVQASPVPKVSIIIPNKDHVDYLEPCVESLREAAGYANYEVFIIENNSTQPATFAFYDRLTSEVDNVRVLRYEGAFNYSAIVNYAVSQTDGDLVMLLNNDTRFLTSDWLAIMAGYFTRSEVGVVGPLITFPDGLVQQAGLAIMTSRRLGFLNQNHSLALHKGYLGSSSCSCNYSAVLGACQMTPRSVFDLVGGYTEELSVTYNDVDYCWKVRETGRVVTYTPHVKICHNEFGSRGSDTANAQRAVQTSREAGIMQQRWPEYFALGDPCLNPNCDHDSPYFKLDV